MSEAQAKYETVRKVIEDEMTACVRQGENITLSPEEQAEILFKLDAVANGSALQIFQSSWNAMAMQVHRIARDKGWWDSDRNQGEIIALIHSELSEALEALRHGNPPDDHIPEFTGTEAELADVIIRIMDYATAFGHRVAEAITAKMDYNTSRERMHGGKKF